MTASTRPEADDSAQDQQRLLELIGQCALRQPTLCLIDPDAAVHWIDVDSGFPIVALGEFTGTVDPVEPRFEAHDPERLRLLLIDRLAARHGERVYRIGPREVAVDWSSLQILTEELGEVRCQALSVGDGTALTLTVTADWEPVVEPLFAPPPVHEAARARLVDLLTDIVAADPRGADMVRSFEMWHPLGSPSRHAVLTECVRESVADTGVEAS